MNRQALDTSRDRVLGLEHPDTLMSVSDLALVLQDQGKYEAGGEDESASTKRQGQVSGA